MMSHLYLIKSPVLCVTEHDLTKRYFSLLAVWEVDHCKYPYLILNNEDEQVCFSFLSEEFFFFVRVLFLYFCSRITGISQINHVSR